MLLARTTVKGINLWESSKRLHGMHLTSAVHGRQGGLANRCSNGIASLRTSRA